MPSVRIGAMELEEEQAVQDLLDALQEADKHLMSNPTWQLIRATAAKFIESGEHTIQGISAGQLLALALATLFNTAIVESSVEVEATGFTEARYQEELSNRRNEMLFNPKGYFKEFECFFTENICFGPEEYDELGIIDLLKKLYTTGMVEPGE